MTITTAPAVVDALLLVGLLGLTVFGAVLVRFWIRAREDHGRRRGPAGRDRGQRIDAGLAMTRAAVVLAAVVVAGCTPPAPVPAAPTPARPTTTATAAGRGLLPNRALTPGEVQTSDLNIVCHQSTALRRNVTAAVRDAAWAEYGITLHTATTFELDHLIPLELGGSNSLANLWPQPAGQPGFHEKDALENALHAAVCKTRKVTLVEAQHAIAIDWVTAWHQYVHP